MEERGTGGKSIWGTVIMVIKAGYDSGQNNNHTITFCFHGKVTFIVTFKEKNKKLFHFYFLSFKRTNINCSLANFKRVPFIFKLLSIMIS